MIDENNSPGVVVLPDDDGQAPPLQPGDGGQS